jgi:hypothetical protein
VGRQVIWTQFELAICTKKATAVQCSATFVGKASNHSLSPATSSCRACEKLENECALVQICRENCGRSKTRD